MIELKLADEKLHDELVLVLKLFFSQQELDELACEFTVEQTVSGLDIYTKVTSNITDKVYESTQKIIDQKFPERYKKRYAKLELFYMLRDFRPDVILPWGSLTGIRPTKLTYELIKECNGDYMKAYKMLVDKFGVSVEKARIVKDIIKNQQFVIKNDNNIKQ